jgi:hypothetical protein
MASMAREASASHDRLAALFLTLATGLSPTQRSKLVRLFGHDRETERRREEERGMQRQNWRADL